jgi:K+/H+ antiporter YhaU regulatory subunit KhtT
MTEEEAQAYADLKDQLAQKEQRIQQVEGLLTLPLALVVGAGGALLGSALGDIWYWSKR